MAPAKPNFRSECGRCIAAAKGLAAREGAKRLDPVHVVAAAVALAPDVASEALSMEGVDLGRVRLLAARYGQVAEAAAELHPIGLVSELRDVVYGGGLPRGKSAETVDLAAFLRALLKRPSFRLNRFLVQVVCEAKEDRAVMKSDADIRPYGSFRDYLADRQRLWVLRRQAADRFGDGIGAPGRSRKGDFGYGADGVLEVVLRLERKLMRRIEATPAAKLAIRCFSEREGLSKVQTELVEGAFLNDLYGLGQPWEDDLTVRAFAQMLAPQSYPRNCAEVLSSCENLVKREVIEARHDGVICRLADRVRLVSHVQDELFDAIGRDGITNGDIRELRYRLEFDDHGR